MFITVAICTWNRAELLNQTLSAMHLLRIPQGVEWELLVVNNNSTDDTDAVIAKHATVLPVRAIFEPRSGKSHAANIILDRARGDFILWTDDDVLVDAGWLAVVVGAAERNPQAAGFGGPIEPWFPTPPDPDFLAAFPAVSKGFCALDYQIPEGPLASDQYANGSNMAFRRAAVAGLRFDMKLGPTPTAIESDSWMSTGGGEDFRFIDDVRKQGGVIMWIPEMRVRHYVSPSRLTLSYLSAHQYEVGRYLIRYRGIPAGPRFLGIPCWIWRKWGEESVKSLLYRLTFRRARHLAALGQVWIHRGMISQCRGLAREKEGAGRIGAKPTIRTGTMPRA
jgi:glucosyl-dolichyl phosphate glucuronosyltransferase